MLRTLVLLLVIAAPLLSQDLLVDAGWIEHSGTLIEITDTYIYFQFQGRVTPTKMPLKSVKRVTLADGRLVYEDGKIYQDILDEFRMKKQIITEPIITEPSGAGRIGGLLIAAAGGVGLWEMSRECEDCDLKELEEFMETSEKIAKARFVLLILGGLLLMIP